MVTAKVSTADNLLTNNSNELLLLVSARGSGSGTVQVEDPDEVAENRVLHVQYVGSGSKEAVNKHSNGSREQSARTGTCGRNVLLRADKSAREQRVE